MQGLWYLIVRNSRELHEFLFDNLYPGVCVAGCLTIGALFFLLAYGHVKRRLGRLEKAQQTVIAGVRDHLRRRGGADTEEVLTEYESAVQRGQEFYAKIGPLMLNTARRSYGLTALSLALALLCVVCTGFTAFGLPLAGRHVDWRVYALSSFVPGLGLAYWGVVRQGEWGNIRTNTGMTSIVWLKLVFPTAFVAGRLDIVVGDLNPATYRDRWMFVALEWLSTQGVRLRLLAADMDFAGLPEAEAGWARSRWLEVLSRIRQSGVWKQDGQVDGCEEPQFLFMREPLRQDFVVTAGVVRVEDEHSLWTRRIAGTRRTVAGGQSIMPTRAVNDLRLFDRERERNHQAIFDAAWRDGRNYSVERDYPRGDAPEALP